VRRRARGSADRPLAVVEGVPERSDADRRGAILEAVAFAAHTFLAEPAWEERIDAVLERLGTAADASRAYVFETRADTDGLRHFQRAEWVGSGVRALIDEDWLQGFTFADSHQERWEELLAAGEVVHGALEEFPSHERPDLERQDILAIACVPVFAGSRWWGFVGFDECREPRRWNADEIDALVAAATILGAAIERRSSDLEHRALVESLPVVTYVQHARGTHPFVYVSPQVEDLLGVTPAELIEDPERWLHLVHPDDRRRVHEADRQAERAGSAFREEFRYLRPDGEVVWVRNEAVPVRDRDGTIVSWQGVIVDVTGSRLAAERARSAEARFQTLVEQIPAVTYLWAESEPGRGDFTTTYVSPRIAEMLGWEPWEWMVRPDLWIETIHPDDREAVVAENDRTDGTGEPFTFEYRKLARDGHIVWVHEEAQLVRGGRDAPREWQGVLFDITELKVAEEELRRSVGLLETADRDRRQLLARVVRAQEEERQRIAADIHDDPIQKMTAVGLRLEALRRAGPESASDELLERLTASVELSIRRLRRLMFELRPPALDREGLEVALREYLRELQDESGLVVKLQARVDPEPAHETRAIAYRIAQEALTNVRKHADASQVEITLETVDDGLRVRIEDDGRGFDPAMTLPRPGHMGLSAIRERAELAGGACRIESAPRRGTTVEFWLPPGAGSTAEGAG
jgi:PAS domain S-box-containing protein